MKKLTVIVSLLTVHLVFLSVMVPLSVAKDDQRVRYSCSSQIYEAFENTRLEAFTKKTGINIDLFISSSNSCVYRVMQDMSDIAGSTRAIYKRHKDHGLIEIPFCRDPLAIITHKNTDIENLTGNELRQIFSGTITNWKEIGGPDLTITLVVPHKDTGAHKNFRRLVMKHKEIEYDYLTYQSTRVLEAVEELPAGAVSFILRGAQITHPNIKVLSIDGRNPGDKDYPYYQIFYLVSKGEPKGSIKRFVDFIRSEKGRAIILKKGMLPI